MPTYLCTEIKDCSIYQNWTHQTNDKRLDIIQKSSNKDPFSCLAFEDLGDVETGIPAGENLEGISIGNNCLHILNLNLKRDILHKLGYQLCLNKI